MTKKNEWVPVLECDNEETGNHTQWALQLPSGKYCWINLDEYNNIYEVEIFQYGDVKVMKECKSMTSAKRWVTTNLHKLDGLAE